MSLKVILCFSTICVYISASSVYKREKVNNIDGIVSRMHHKEEVSFAVRKWTLQNAVKSPESTGCSCIKYDCGCCAHLDIPKVHINDTGCLNITYLPNDYGISVTFSIDKKVYINETVSARNPPPLCFDVPYVDFASLCLRFSNLSISGNKFSGCVSVEASLYHVKVESVKLGCFHIGSDFKAIRKLEDQNRKSMF